MQTFEGPQESHASRREGSVRPLSCSTQMQREALGRCIAHAEPVLSDTQEGVEGKDWILMASAC